MASLTGKPITEEGGLGPDIISPIWTSTARRDPVVAGAIANGVTVGQPSRGTMNPLEHNRYRAAAGPAVHDALAGYMASLQWASSSPEDRADAASRVTSKTRKTVKSGMMGRPSGSNGQWDRYLADPLR